MSQLNKQQLETLNQTNFPNNTTGYISPSLLREFNTDSIDSFTLQSQFDSVSSSVDSRLDSLESFSSSLAIDYINQTELNQATASLSASLTTTINQKLNTSSFNSYTSSTNGRLDTIESNYASKNAVNTFTQDQIIVGSLEVQESLIVDFSASFGTHVSMSGLDNYGDTRLGANASSINTVIGRTYLPGTLWINNVSWSFYSASIYTANEFIGNNPNLSFQAFSTSVDSRLDSLENFSSSLADTYATDVELASVSSSIMSTLNTFSSSYKVDSGSFNTRINTNSSSFNTFSSSYTTESASFSTRINTEVSASTFFSGTQYKTDSSSFDSRLDSEEFKSTTFATTGSNTFVGLQTIQDNALHMKGQYPFVQLASNAEGSGSEFANIELNVDSTVYSNTYSGISINNRANESSFLLAGIAATTFTPEFGGEYVGLIAGGGTNVNGSSTAIIFRTGSGDMLVYKPTSFAFGVNITGSVILSSSADVELTVVGKTVSSGSVQGNVGNISVVSNTASIDMSRGNFFNLNIPSASNTFITATNIQPGQTVAVKLQQAANSSGSVTFNPSQFKFWSGSAQYNTGSQATGSVDIFTFVTFDTSSLWTTIVKNLV